RIQGRPGRLVCDFWPQIRELKNAGRGFDSERVRDRQVFEKRSDRDGERMHDALFLIGGQRGNKAYFHQCRISKQWPFRRRSLPRDTRYRDIVAETFKVSGIDRQQTPLKSAKARALFVVCGPENPGVLRDAGLTRARDYYG